MLVLGGILMLFVDKWFNKPKEDSQEITYKNAFAIGFFQCIAMIPRSVLFYGYYRRGDESVWVEKNAAEFSFSRSLYNGCCYLCESV